MGCAARQQQWHHRRCKTPFIVPYRMNEQSVEVLRIYQRTKFAGSVLTPGRASKRVGRLRYVLIRAPACVPMTVCYTFYAMGGTTNSEYLNNATKIFGVTPIA
jgi:hypothetical protein